MFFFFMKLFLSTANNENTVIYKLHKCTHILQLYLKENGLKAVF